MKIYYTIYVIILCFLRGYDNSLYRPDFLEVYICGYVSYVYGTEIVSEGVKKYLRSQNPT